MMRFKYYKLTFRQMRFNKKPFVFIFLFIISIVFLYFILMEKIEPSIKELCEYEARTTALIITNKAIEKDMQDVKYESLVTIKEDNTGKIRSITSNTVEMNKLASKISIDIQDELDKAIYSDMTVPLGTIFGNNLFGGYGPKIRIKSILSGLIDIKFLSKFEEAGINQTTHKIILSVETNMMTIAPFYSDTQKYTNNIIVAESVIVGEIPATYYSISGMENITDKDMLDLIN